MQRVRPFGVHDIHTLAVTTAHIKGACLLNVKELLRHRSTHQTNRYRRKQIKSNLAVDILSTITPKAKNESDETAGRKEGEANAA
ncbi:hypothetical protein [Halodesulfovibrio sp. MK-HDV]|uniref:hypothetical protein n=1 Tax=Halodesulfovibrio sp. MK-HDV TaxID=2599925 RepID=UPI0013F83C4C|nr:hypothetical protein [Halodesulfovibrio sp. MK-HDV]KAF1073322.1 hypothetical protein MKHDV_03684 [Halodesulfovibrio sp. MK-HDV]